MGMLKNYVLGFIFSESGNSVLLIRKNRPEWQAGFLNGIGGKIGDTIRNESPLEAMSRECKEETGFEIKDWKQFCILNKYLEYRIYCFYCVVEDIYEGWRQIEDEEVDVYNVQYDDYATGENIDNPIPNLKWLIPMALNHYSGADKTEMFNIEIL